MSKIDEVSQRIMNVLEKKEIVHLRQLLQELPYSLREIRRALQILESRGAVESFRHGGYTFYRLPKREEELEEYEYEVGGGSPEKGEESPPEEA